MINILTFTNTFLTAHTLWVIFFSIYLTINFALHWHCTVIIKAGSCRVNNTFLYTLHSNPQCTWAKNPSTAYTTYQNFHTTNGVGIWPSIWLSLHSVDFNGWQLSFSGSLFLTMITLYMCGLKFWNLQRCDQELCSPGMCWWIIR